MSFRRGSRRYFRPRLERLESRLLLRRYDVDTFEDSVAELDGLTSFREAITAAIADAEADSIVLKSGDYRITRPEAGEDRNATGDFDITGPGALLIQGQGKDKTFIDGADLDRVIHIITSSFQNPIGLPGNPNVTLRDLTIRHGAASDFGGGIFVDTRGAPGMTLLTLENVRIEDNTAARSGGGLAAHFRAQIDVKHSDIRRNHAGENGGGMTLSTGQLTLSGTTIRNNTAGRDGGGISVGAVPFEGGASLHHVGLQLRDNTRVADNEAAGSGGGIFAGLGVVALATGSVVLNNAATSHGGGIAASSAEVQMFDSAVRNNQSEGQGGGIYSTLGMVRLEDDSAVHHNNAAMQGGGIYARDGGVNLMASSVHNNDAEMAGGGIATVLGTVTVAASTIHNNQAGGEGGGISSILGPIALDGSEVNGNVAELDGGGIASEGLVLLSQSDVHHNRAKGGSGGGISILGGEVVVTSHSRVRQNDAAAAGGGIAATTGQVRISTGSQVSGNTAGAGGGGIATASGLVLIEDASVNDNHARGEGGGVSTLTGRVALARGAVEGNTASGSGGGIASLGGSVHLLHSRVNDNDASFQGGGIFARGNVFLAESTLHGNKALEDGGGILAAGAFLHVDRSTISGNLGLQGAGVFIGKGSSTQAELVNSTISGNIARLRGDGLRAGRAAGGGIAIDGESLVRLLHVTIAANEARIGGGVYVLNGSIRVRNTLIAANRARGDGPDVLGEFLSEGHNLIGIADASSGFSGELNDKLGTADEPIDPRLGAFSGYGGPSRVYALLADSPAIDAGNNDGAPHIDQRGFPRPVDGPDADDLATVDIGAFEFAAMGPPTDEAGASAGMISNGQALAVPAFALPGQPVLSSLKGVAPTQTVGVSDASASLALWVRVAQIVPAPSVLPGPLLNPIASPAAVLDEVFALLSDAALPSWRLAALAAALTAGKISP
jgi:predicted outer membrane repeat protein